MTYLKIHQERQEAHGQHEIKRVTVEILGKDGEVRSTITASSAAALFDGLGGMRDELLGDQLSSGDNYFDILED